MTRFYELVPNDLAPIGFNRLFGLNIFLCFCFQHPCSPAVRVFTPAPPQKETSFMLILQQRQFFR